MTGRHAPGAMKVLVITPVKRLTQDLKVIGVTINLSDRYLFPYILDKKIKN